MPTMNVQGRKTRIAGVINTRADVIQCINQIADRTFMHSCDTMYGVVATHRCQRRGERTDRCARITHEQISGMRRESTTGTLDCVILTLAVLMPADP